MQSPHDVRQRGAIACGMGKGGGDTMIRIITALALRLLAMYVLATLALSLTVFLLQTRFEWGALRGDNWTYLGGVLVVFVLVAGIGALLWRLGTRALRTADRHDGGMVPAAPSRTDLLTLQRTLFALLGLYFAVHGLLGLLRDLVLHLDRNVPWVADLPACRWRGCCNWSNY